MSDAQIEQTGPREVEPSAAAGHRTPARSTGALGIGAVAFGAVALGATAIGALAIGRLAIGALALKRARVRTLMVDHLEVRRLDVRELNIDDVQPSAARKVPFSGGTSLAPNQVRPRRRFARLIFAARISGRCGAAGRGRARFEPASGTLPTAGLALLRGCDRRA